MKKINFTNNDYSLIKRTIREYDIKEAGYNLCKYYNLLSDNIMNKLDKLTKDERHIEIGKLQRDDSKFSKNLMIAFSNIQDEFISSNNLSQSDILSIKKDAIFVIGKVCNNIQFGNSVLFIKKNSYSSFYRIGKYEFYYNNKNNNLDIKGITDLNHPLLDDFKSIIKLYDLGNNKDLIFKKLQKFRYEYLNFDLDSEYYREIQSKMFRISKKYNQITGLELLIPEIDEETFDYIDISYNYINLIAPLISLLI